MKRICFFLLPLYLLTLSGMIGVRSYRVLMRLNEKIAISKSCDRKLNYEIVKLRTQWAYSGLFFSRKYKDRKRVKPFAF